MPTDADHSRLEPFLEQFGLREFRPGQRDVVETVLSGKDCLCIMPTGGGKSLCYQLPSIAREGITLVVSPLIALMKDQVDALQQKGFRADYLNSSLIPSEQMERLDRLRAGEYDLLYVAPERFRSRYFVQAALDARVQLLAIDEAHCISEWGHDFRHDYARLGKFREQLGNPQTIALTATATPNVREDVIQQLEMEDPQVFIAGFARPNLKFSVAQAGTRTEKEAILIDFIRRTPGSGIIYSSTRKGCEQIATAVNSGALNRKVGVYHAGLMPEERRAAQEDFMSDRTPIVVATNAFGMGIDKPDVRFVVHFNMPGTLEAYYQEAGRAGRDGETSSCLLLYSARDRNIQEFFIENAYPSPAVVKSVYDYLRRHADDPIEITQQELQNDLALELSAEGVGTCERLLERSGAIQRLEPQNNMAIVRINSDLPTLVDLLPKKATKRRKILRAVENLTKGVRHDDVYVRPADVANQVSLPTNNVSRALRELNDLDVFEYIPPFRGRAIHVVDRKKIFSKLEIDFSSLTERKAADYEKLRHVMRYATTEHCRQLEMLRYFQDPTAQECETCDNCETRAERPAPPSIDSSDDRVLQTVRIALSGVARARQRFGKQMIAAMLGGSRSAKVTKWRLDELSTFGLLRSWRQTEIVELLDAMTTAGLFGQNEIDRYRPVLKLTPRGEEVMRGTSGLTSSFLLPNAILRRIDASPVAAPKKREVEPTSGEKDSNDKRPSVDSNDGLKVIGDEAADKPGATTGNENELGSASGPVIDSASEPTPSTISSGTEDSSEIQGIKDGESEVEYWTWRLAARGFSLEEIVAIRRLDVAEVLEQLSNCVDSGRLFDPSLLFPTAMTEQFDQIHDDDGKPKRVDSAHFRLYRKCRTSRSTTD